MTLKKPFSDKFKHVQVTFRPDQEEKVKRLQSLRLLSKLFQDALDQYEKNP